MNTRSAAFIATTVATLALVVTAAAPGFAQQAAASAPDAAPAAAATPTPPAASAEKLSYSNNWRIQCNHNATSAGTLVFHLTPKGGTTQELTVTIAKPIGENEVARAIRDQFRKQLDSKAYKVETDDGEDVLVKKRGGTADFALQKITGSVESVKITLEKE